MKKAIALPAALLALLVALTITGCDRQVEYDDDDDDDRRTSQNYERDDDDDRFDDDDDD